VRAEALFLNGIAKLKRRVILRSVHRILLRACLISLIICAILLIIGKTGLSSYSEYGSFYVISIGMALFVSFLIAFVKRKNFLNILIDIDTRFKLQDRLSTAYEYRKFGKKTVFLDLQMQDAAAKLRQLSTQQLFPAKFSLLHLVLILLILINVALYSTDYLLSVHKSTRADQNKLEKVSTLLQNYTIRRTEDKKTKKTRRSDVYAKKLEHLRNKLNDRSLTQDQLFTTLNRFLEEIQGEQTRLADELDVKLNAAGIEEMSIQNIPNPAKLSASKLDKLKMLLKRVLNNQIPDPINQNIETLQELYSMEKLLSQIIDDFNEGKSHSEAFAEYEGNETRGSQYTNDPKKPHNDAKHSKTNREFLSKKRGRGDTIDQAASGPLQGNGRDLQDELGRHAGYSPSAGNTQSAGEKKSSYELEKSPGFGTHDKMISSQVENYLIHIRSLTTIGESRLKEEDIIRSYRQEVEGILHKEDIPLNYREYIKHYFISIGLKAEKNVNELK